MADAGCGSQRAAYFAKRLHGIRLFWLRRLSIHRQVRAIAFRKAPSAGPFMAPRSSGSAP